MAAAADVAAIVVKYPAVNADRLLAYLTVMELRRVGDILETHLRGTVRGVEVGPDGVPLGQAGQGAVDGQGGEGRPAEGSGLSNDEGAGAPAP